MELLKLTPQTPPTPPTPQTPYLQGKEAALEQGEILEEDGRLSATTFAAPGVWRRSLVNSEI